MMQDLTVRLKQADVSKAAINTTLANTFPLARGIVESLNNKSIVGSSIGYYIRPYNYARADSKEINKARLVYDLVYKELLISGNNIITYQVHEMVKDATETRDNPYQYQNIRYPFGLGPRAEQHSISVPRMDEISLNGAQYIFVPDLLNNDKHIIPNNVSEMYSSWIRRCADKHDICFVFFGLMELKRTSNLWSVSLASFLQENLIEIPVQ